MAKGAKTGGRKAGTPNKVTANLREAAQEFSGEALAMLVSVMRDPETPPNTKLAASTAILDRGYGRPRQEVEQKIQVVNPFPSDEELDKIYLSGMAEAARKEALMREQREKLGIDFSDLLVGKLN